MIRKAISPIITVIILLLIALVGSIFTYTIVMNTLIEIQPPPEQNPIIEIYGNVTKMWHSEGFYYLSLNRVTYNIDKNSYGRVITGEFIKLTLTSQTAFYTEYKAEPSKFTKTVLKNGDILG